MKEIDIDNKKIFVFDNILDYTDQCDLYSIALDRAFVNKNLDRNNHMDRKYNKWRCDLSQKEVEESCLFKALQIAMDKVFKDKSVKITPISSYINYSTFADVDLPHVDSIDLSETLSIKTYTFLLYGNNKWDVDWSGETKFYTSDLSEIAYSSIFKPGRAILFDGTIPHSAVPPSRLSNEPRYTFVIKLDIKEI